MNKPMNMLVSYFPKKGHEQALLALIKKHYPAVLKAGLATDEPAQIWRATDKRSGASYFVERFAWINAEAPDLAHQTPEIMAVWEPMGPVMENMTIVKIEEV